MKIKNLLHRKPPVKEVTIFIKPLEGDEKDKIVIKYKKYVCKKCKKTFFTERGLEVHMMMIHSKKSHKKK